MHVADWGPITTIVRLLEALLDKFSVPMAYIDGHSVLNLAERAELDSRPTPEQLLECIANVDQVGSLIRIPQRIKLFRIAIASLFAYFLALVKL